MYCPTCKTQPLHAQLLDERLPAHHCNQCDGHFLKASEYFNWLDQRAEILPEQPYTIAAHPNKAEMLAF